ncbi:MAG: DMT family transporter [Desulfobacteraceae bacterium]|nr:DMT family transporter [Desulfobacteraceae bacterium]
MKQTGRRNIPNTPGGLTQPGVPFGWLSRKAVTALGWLAIVHAEVCFYISTIFIRLSKADAMLDPGFFVFCRFLMGFFVVCGLLLIQRRDLRPRRYDLLAGRAVFNSISVFCFFKAVSVTSLAEGNILNMTYPVFLAAISWFVLKEQRDRVAIGMVAIAIAGIWLILAPEQMAPNINNFWGLASGMTASLAVLYLNMSRRHHDTETILFYMFGIGAMIMFSVFHDRIFWPDPKEFYYLFWCAASGVAGQYLLTLGYRYVTAVEGSVLSSSRILMAAVFGPWMALDPALTAAGWMGAGLILTANVVLAVRRSRNK